MKNQLLKKYTNNPFRDLKIKEIIAKYESSVAKVICKHDNNFITVYVYVTKTNTYLQNYTSIIHDVKKYFKQNIKLVPIFTDKKEDQIITNIHRIVDRFKKMQVPLIIKNIPRTIENLMHTFHLSGIRIQLAGKLYGLRHMRKVFNIGKMKFTGNNLRNDCIKYVTAINTNKGIVGFQIRLLLGRSHEICYLQT